MKRTLCFLLILLLVPSFCLAELFSKQEVLDVIQTILSDNFDYCKVYEDEGFIYVHVAMNGVAAQVMLIESQGYDETHESWMKVKQSIKDIYGATIECLETFGFPNELVSICLLNDLNKDSVLYINSMGLDFYDVLSDDNLIDLFE